MVENFEPPEFECMWKEHYETISARQNKFTFIIILIIATLVLISDVLLTDYPFNLFIIRLCASALGFTGYFIFMTGKMHNHTMILLYVVPAAAIANYMVASQTDAIGIVQATSYVAAFGFAMISILFLSPKIWMVISATTLAEYFILTSVFGSLPLSSYLYNGGTIIILSFIGFPYVARIRYKLSRENFALHNENERQKAELEFLANNDALTGCFNRRGGINMLEHFKEHSDRHGLKLSISFIDMDGLKTVNDRLGHAEGDNFIRTLSDIIKENIRKSDTLFRYGGDEFIIIFHGCSEAESGSIMKKIEKAAGSNSRPYPLSFSYGTVEYDGRMSSDEIISKADVRMYENKLGKK